MTLKPGMKVTVTIEATVIQAYAGTPTHVVYGDERTLVIHHDEPGVTVTIADA
jgi:hypothetical protein